MSIDFSKLKDLVKYADENDLDLLEIKYKDFYFKIEKKLDITPVSTVPVSYSLPESNTKNQPASLDNSKKEIQDDSNLKKIEAPLSGVFYRAPAPGAKPFVEVGDRISKGDVLCIIEAMKVMNELQSDVDGIVKLIIPENGSVISKGDVLFLIE